MRELHPFPPREEGKSPAATAHERPPKNQNTGGVTVDRIKNDSPILYFGLNQGAKSEARALRGSDPSASDVTAITNEREAPGGKDAVHPQAVLAPDRLAALGLPQPLIDSLTSSAFDTFITDELFALVRVLWAAESGERSIERFVLSGHSDGHDLWGDANGKISIVSLLRVISYFPKAAAGVRHLFVGACNNGWRAELKLYQGVFPSLASFWGYAGSSPGAKVGGAAHLARWRTGTEPGQAGLSSSIFAGTRDGEYVALWTPESDYVPASAAAEGMEAMQLFMSPWVTVLSDAYLGKATSPKQLLDLQGIVHASLDKGATGNVDDDLIAKLQGWRDQILRIRFWPQMIATFASAYHDALAAGYAELSRRLASAPTKPRPGVPDFAKMDRQTFLIAEASFETLLGDAQYADSPELTATFKLMRGAAMLDPTILLTEWA